MDSRQQQIQHDAQLGNTQVGNIYYSICPDNDNYYRTIRLHRNPLTGNIESQVSNPVYGDPESTGFIVTKCTSLVVLPHKSFKLFIFWFLDPEV